MTHLVEMVCKRCGTEIADAALVCYRCGEATAQAAPEAHSGKPRPPSRGPAVLGLLVLVVAALMLGQAGTAAVPALVGWGLAGAAGTMLVWYLATRRRQ